MLKNECVCPQMLSKDKLDILTFPTLIPKKNFENDHFLLRIDQNGY
jgi:hypothetical protein